MSVCNFLEFSYWAISKYPSKIVNKHSIDFEFLPKCQYVFGITDISESEMRKKFGIISTFAICVISP